MKTQIDFTKIIKNSKKATRSLSKIVKTFSKGKARSKKVIPGVFLLLCGFCIGISIFVIQNSETIPLQIKDIVEQVRVKGVDNKDEFYPVIQVIDGDTIKVNINGIEETIRMIGIDTPESVHPNQEVECFGVEASERLKQLLEGKNVKLVVDESQGNADRYGRLLRYVYSEDGTNINLKMILDGFGHEYTYKSPYKYIKEFKTAEEYAMKNDLGFWGTECK